MIRVPKVMRKAGGQAKKRRRGSEQRVSSLPIRWEGGGGAIGRAREEDAGRRAMLVGEKREGADDTPGQRVGGTPPKDGGTPPRQRTTANKETLEPFAANTHEMFGCRGGFRNPGPPPGDSLDDSPPEVLASERGAGGGRQHRDAPMSCGNGVRPLPNWRRRECPYVRGPPGEG